MQFARAHFALHCVQAALHCPFVDLHSVQIDLHFEQVERYCVVELHDFPDCVERLVTVIAACAGMASRNVTNNKVNVRQNILDSIRVQLLRNMFEIYHG